MALVVTTATGMQASRQAERAAVSTARADAQRLGDLALASTETDHALLLAVQGVRLDNTPAARSVLLAVLSRSPQLIGVSHVRPDAVGPMRNGVFSHRGDLSVSVTANRTVTVWDVATGARIEELHGHADAVRTMEFSPDDATLRTIDTAGTVMVWDLRGDRRFASRHTVADRNRGARTTMIARPDGAAVVAVASAPGATWMRILDLTGGVSGEPFGTRATGRITPVWRPDGGRIATTDSDGFLRTWDPATGAYLAGRHSWAWVGAATAYDADGRTILMASRNGNLYRTDAETLALVDSPVDIGDRLGAVAAAPGGRLAATLGAPTRSDDVRLTRYAIVDLADGTVYRRGRLAFDATGLAFAPDGRRLAIAGQMGQLLVLDVRTGRPIRPAVIGHNSSVLTVAYSPDGTRMVTGGYDGRVGLWNARTGEMLGSLLPGARGTAIRPVFLPDGHTVLIPAEDGTVTRWDARPARWLAFACAVAGRDLTRAEWADALGPRPYRKTC
ncbi:MAG TPA: WD40 repeat domain-containing protein [Actinoplanes sp.]|nr:WD40 repeat domain-containing protein [Actinoplanes sp.]